MQPPVPPVSSDLNERRVWKMSEKGLSVLPALSRYHRPAPILPVKGRYHWQFKFLHSAVLRKFGCRYYRRFTGTTGGSRYHRSKPGTTGSSFSRKLRRRASTAGTTDPEGRYYLLTLAEKKFPSCSCVQGVSQAQKLSWSEHPYPHLTNSICIPLDSAAFPRTQAKNKNFVATWVETPFIH